MRSAVSIHRSTWRGVLLLVGLVAGSSSVAVAEPVLGIRGVASWLHQTQDAKLELRGGGVSAHVRHRADELLVSGQLKRGDALCIVGGQIVHSWGLGLAWPGGEPLRDGPASSAGRSRPMLRLRSSVSRTVPKRTGLAIRLGSRESRFEGAAWGWDEAWGVGGRWRGLGFSLGRARDQIGPGWLGSVLLSWSSLARGDVIRAASSTRFTIEVAGRRGPASIQRLALGLRWTLDPHPTMGIWQGRLWTGPPDGLSSRKDERERVYGSDMRAGWEIRWALPRLPYLQSELRLSSTQPGGTAGRSMAQRDVRLCIETALLSTLKVRLALRQTEVLGAAPSELQTAHQALGLRTQTSVDLRLSLLRADRLAVQLRLREAIGRRGLWEPSLPTASGSAPSTEQPAHGDAPLDPWAFPGHWQEEQGHSLTALSLRSVGSGPWRWGLLAAMTGATGGGHSYLPLRLPPGRVIWRVIGQGTWLLETWAGWRTGVFSWEVMARLRAGVGGENPRVEGGGGIRWSLGI